MHMMTVFWRNVEQMKQKGRATQSNKAGTKGKENQYSEDFNGDNLWTEAKNRGNKSEKEKDNNRLMMNVHESRHTNHEWCCYKDDIADILKFIMISMFWEK